MLRRLVRFVVRAGIVGAAVAGAAKLLGGRRSGEPAPTPAAGPLPRQAWPRLEPDPGAQEPSRQTALQPDPEAPVAPVPPPEAAPEAAPEADVAWVEPEGDVCPTTHPVKAKLASKIFHVPGGQMYERTRPDRCYRDAAAAEADGLRQAKR